MVRRKSAKEFSQDKPLAKNEIEHGQKNVRKLPQKGEKEQLFRFKVVREKRGVHTFAHGE